MKRTLFCIMLGLFSASVFAQTCPPASNLFVPSKNGYDVVPPPGWNIILNKRIGKHNHFIFRVAAWGDHKHPTDSVRCHYYASSSLTESIGIETTELLDRSRIPWTGNDKLYDLCVSHSDNVNECPFK